MAGAWFAASMIRTRARHRVTSLVAAWSVSLLGTMLVAPRPAARAAEQNKGLHEMEVLGVATDQESGQPTILLRGKQGKQPLSLERGGKELTPDSRPSDAIALALRAGVPIYANARARGGARPSEKPQ